MAYFFLNEKIFMLKIIALLISLILLLIGCQGKNTLSDQIKKEIDNKCEMNVSCSISLKDITTFKWDKVAIFQVGSSSKQISKALGVEYKGETDLMTGMVFVLNNKIVYEERIPYEAEHPTRLQVWIEKMDKDPNCVVFTVDNAIIPVSKKEIEDVIYYLINIKVSDEA